MPGGVADSARVPEGPLGHGTTGDSILEGRKEEVTGPASLTPGGTGGNQVRSSDGGRGWSSAEAQESERKGRGGMGSVPHCGPEEKGCQGWRGNNTQSPCYPQFLGPWGSPSGGDKGIHGVLVWLVPRRLE